MNNYDMAVYDRQGQLAAVAEVKAKTGTSRDWATAWRRNLLAHSESLGQNYFLLATPDQLYLWEKGSVQEVQPSFVVDARPIFKPYIEKSNVEPQEISGRAFELVVAAWLADLLKHNWDPDASVERDWLVESGFEEAIKDGRIDFEVAA